MISGHKLEYKHDVFNYAKEYWEPILKKGNLAYDELNYYSQAIEIILHESRDRWLHWRKKTYYDAVEILGMIDEKIIETIPPAEWI